MKRNKNEDMKETYQTIDYEWLTRPTEKVKPNFTKI
jgi:hypothetical protein